MNPTTYPVVIDWPGKVWCEFPGGGLYVKETDKLLPITFESFHKAEEFLTGYRKQGDLDPSQLSHDQLVVVKSDWEATLVSTK